ncbi:TetR/AcrR family transcriptional regulator [Nocardia seriolae]|uniref:HTH-type transcriptional regulator PksA n=1 Tax=Nocardia seriolae TaxID=37332 RepID=A0A0B8N2G5_9NOCA|nr:TetR/AcrR family transcriptional regulator [Nocardia seriolae]APA98146.1 HTH-type transcriptional regulator PksA [Nocardia seriolae]MTJ62831.1 TetR family transcriptional regulator [Nocardia seriolae]MTJ73507.1 TetR family transcriptional regulator [Nocardia seriolae]MTJ87865.1 TetR family transcriptional regulator [Nocardia seriolae]MTK31858.1 TetR family transcriptional regulator [Nocardia seriolae]
MPRLVDHEQRRREITTAARKVIAAGGLDAATFQSVAAEAGISVRLIQYYFGTKRDLMLATHRAVVEDWGKGFAQALGGLGPDASPREVIRAVSLGLIPLDDVRHQDNLVFAAFHAANLTGNTVTSEEMMGAPRYLMTSFTEQLRRERPGESEALATELDAELIVLAVTGVSQAILAGGATRERAVELLDHMLDRVFVRD